MLCHGPLGDSSFRDGDRGGLPTGSRGGSILASGWKVRVDVIATLHFPAGPKDPSPPFERLRFNVSLVLLLPMLAISIESPAAASVLLTRCDNSSLEFVGTEFVGDLGTRGEVECRATPRSCRHDVSANLGAGNGAR